MEEAEAKRQQMLDAQKSGKGDGKKGDAGISDARKELLTKELMMVLNSLPINANFLNPDL